MAIGGLGSGLDFLFDENIADIQVKKTLRLSEIEPNREQPRKTFSEDSISALADSIRQHGLLQPIVVRPVGDFYQIVAGERRWRAAKMLGLDEVPVIIKELSDIETMQIALIENLLRENLNPMEEANGFQDLIDKFNMTQEEVAKTVGRSRSSVANALRLLKLPEKVQELVKKGDISAGHAKALLAISDEKFLIETAEKCAEGNMTVRAVEKLATKESEPPEAEVPKSNKKIDSYFKEMELSLAEHLGRKVAVHYGKNKGALVLEFYDKEDLSQLVSKLN